VASHLVFEPILYLKVAKNLDQNMIRHQQNIVRQAFQLPYHSPEFFSELDFSAILKKLLNFGRCLLFPVENLRNREEFYYFLGPDVGVVEQEVLLS
jgi:hypothetical protein